MILLVDKGIFDYGKLAIKALKLVTEAKLCWSKLYEPESGINRK